MKVYELFAGCGGAGVGMKIAGYELTGGIEYHHAAADIYDANHDIPLTRANILDIDRIPSVDIVWSSPPCPSFSLANNNRGETEKDINLAKHIAKLIVASRPTSVAIENVRGYWGSNSCDILLDALDKAGYNIQHSIECAADYGAATTRRRLIVRASLNPILPLVKTHQKVGFDADQLSLFDILPNWVSWYDAIESFIHTLPKSTLTDNQSAALSKREIPLPPLINSTVLSERKLSPIITAFRGSQVSSNSRILIERLGYRGEPNIYTDSKPCPTIRAHTHLDDHGCYRIAANIIDNFECFAADIRCLAAWQSFPSYNWLSNRGEAGRCIGNAVPPLLARSIALSFS